MIVIKKLKILILMIVVAFTVACVSSDMPSEQKQVLNDTDSTNIGFNFEKAPKVSEEANQNDSQTTTQNKEEGNTIIDPLMYEFDEINIDKYRIGSASQIRKVVNSLEELIKLTSNLYESEQILERYQLYDFDNSSLIVFTIQHRNTGEYVNYSRVKISDMVYINNQYFHPEIAGMAITSRLYILSVDKIVSDLAVQFISNYRQEIDVKNYRINYSLQNPRIINSKQELTGLNSQWFSEYNDEFFLENSLVIYTIYHPTIGEYVYRVNVEVDDVLYISNQYFRPEISGFAMTMRLYFFEIEKIDSNLEIIFNN